MIKRIKRLIRPANRGSAPRVTITDVPCPCCGETGHKVEDLAGMELIACPRFPDTGLMAVKGWRGSK